MESRQRVAAGGAERFAGGRGVCSLAKRIATRYRPAKPGHRLQHGLDTGSSLLGSAKDKKQHLDSSTVNSVPKRVIAENGRDPVKGYAFAIIRPAVVAGTTGVTAWNMESGVNADFATHGAHDPWRSGAARGGTEG